MGALTPRRGPMGSPPLPRFVPLDGQLVVGPPVPEAVQADRRRDALLEVSALRAARDPDDGWADRHAARVDRILALTDREVLADGRGDPPSRGLLQVKRDGGACHVHVYGAGAYSETRVTYDEATDRMWAEPGDGSPPVAFVPPEDSTRVPRRRAAMDVQRD